jgi:hypothetical protein
MKRHKQQPAEIVFRREAGYLDVVATTSVVTAPFLDYLLDTIEVNIADFQGQFILVLLEIIAPRADISLIEAYEIWRRASAMGIRRTQIAYLVTGRPIGAVARFMETVARNRGILLQFFDNRNYAVEWLCPESRECKTYR